MKKAKLVIISFMSLMSLAAPKDCYAAQGPVVVESGKSTFQFTDKFVIKNDFKVKSGASLEIRASN